MALTRETLVKIKKGSLIAGIVGVVIALLSTGFYFFADYELGKLDEMKLDEGIKLDKPSDPIERIKLGK